MDEFGLTEQLIMRLGEILMGLSPGLRRDLRALGLQQKQTLYEVVQRENETAVEAGNALKKAIEDSNLAKRAQGDWENARQEKEGLLCGTPAKMEMVIRD